MHFRHDRSLVTAGFAASSMAAGSLFSWLTFSTCLFWAVLGSVLSAISLLGTYIVCSCYDPQLFCTNAGLLSCPLAVRGLPPFLYLAHMRLVIGGTVNTYVPDVGQVPLSQRLGAV